MECDPPHYWRV